MFKYLPIKFHEGNLGQRHKHINQLVHDTAEQNVLFQTIEEFKETSAVDRLFKINLASKYKNVDYIIENLKETNMLYVSRALKSTWLITDPRYLDIINPEYLEKELYPKMLTTAVNKMMHCIYLHLKDKTRCLFFYQYYKVNSNLKTAKYFLRNCPEKFILNESNIYFEDITPHDLKFLCEKCPPILLEYFKNVTISDKVFSNFIVYKRKIFNICKLVLKSNPEIYFDIIEKFCDEPRFNRRISHKATQFIMRNHKNRYTAKPELYAGVIFQLPTLAQCLDQEEIKDLIIRLARAEYLRPWFTLTYKTAEPLLQRISKEDRSAIVKKIFREKNFGPMVQEAPYVFPVLPTRNSDKGIFSECEDGDEFHRYRKITKRVIKKRKGPKYDMIAIRTLLDELFDKYRFVGFTKTFYELKKRLLTESSHQNRLMILNVLVSKTLKRAENIHMLLELVSSRHANEPATLRASFLRSLVHRAAAYRLPIESWQIFRQMVLQVIFKSEEPVPCDEGLYAIIIYDTLNDFETAPEVLDKFITIFNPLVEYELSANEKIKLCKRLYDLLISKAENFMQESKLTDAVETVEKVIVLLKAYKVDIRTRVEVLNMIKQLADRDFESTKNLLIQVYNMKSYRKMFTKENFLLIQTEGSYLNALRHDMSLLTDTKKFEELVSNGALKLDRFLSKLKIYFEELRFEYLRIIEDRIKEKPGDEFSLNLARGLCVLLGSAPLSMIREMYAGGKDARRLAERLTANMHRVWSMNDDQYAVCKDIGVIAAANALQPLPAAACRSHIPSLLEGPTPFLRLAVFLVFAKLLPGDILNVTARIHQDSKPAMKRVLLRRLYLYMRSKGATLESDIWNEMKTLMLDIRSHYNTKLWDMLCSIDVVPEAIKVDYCLTILAINYSVEFKLDKTKNIFKILLFLNKNLGKLSEVDILNIFEPFLETEFERRKLSADYVADAKWYYDRLLNIKIRILVKILFACDTQTIQDERFRKIAEPFLNTIKNLWDEKKDGSYIVRRYFDTFLYDLKCSKIFVRPDYINCLIVFEKILTHMRSFLDVKRYFSLYSHFHLTMVYYKAVKHISKQRPNMLAAGTEKCDVAAAVGFVFGRYLAREHRELVTSYFPTITHIYLDDLKSYIERYSFGSGDVFNKFKMSLVKGLIASQEASSLFLATILVHEAQLLFFSRSDPEVQEVYKSIENSNDLQVQCCLSAS